MQEFGFYGKGNIAIAEEENTPRNGVMTSIEDFISGKRKILKPSHSRSFSG
ncbi:hypothetical protein [Rickettsiella massiliensis]|uniref:hypothetical protein n=1 Tax=Rickettsiella massiliensis TaxID=676517 RepID=UPI000302CBD1|nr:hypothetical protein [Rickettsiella massiliensis]